MTGRTNRPLMQDYLVRSGRICVAGLNTGNVERTAVAMAMAMAAVLVAAVLGD